MEPKTRRGCLWAGCGVAIVAVMVVVAVVGGVAWVVYQGSRFSVERSDAAHAKGEFDTTRQRFRGQPPLVTIGADGSTSLVPRARAGQASPESLHVLVWTPGQKELAHVQVPFWIVRLGGPNAKFSLNGVDAAEQLRKINVSLDDLERSGPGLVIDHTDSNGAQTMIWTE